VELFQRTGTLHDPSQDAARRPLSCAHSASRDERLCEFRESRVQGRTDPVLCGARRCGRHQRRALYMVVPGVPVRRAGTLYSRITDQPFVETNRQLYADMPRVYCTENTAMLIAGQYSLVIAAYESILSKTPIAQADIPIISSRPSSRSPLLPANACAPGATRGKPHLFLIPPMSEGSDSWYQCF